MIGWLLAATLSCSEPTADALSAPARGESITLEQVLASVEAEHPSLGASAAARARADAIAWSTRGAFDPRLRVRSVWQPLGYYDNAVLDTEVRARTVALGMTAFAGWRIGAGRFAAYDGKLRTAQGGEVRAGIELPLLRDAAVDAPRTARAKADNGREIAASEQAQRRLELLRDAAAAYWSWVAAGARAGIRARQLELAQARDAGIAQQIAEGNAAAFEALDNQRVIATRALGLVNAEQEQGRAALQLSLFLRDDQGAPRMPSQGPPPLSTSLPPPLTDDAPIEQDIAHALTRRPETLAFDRRLRNAELDVRLAKNQRLPSLTATAFVAKDLGEGDPTLTPVELAVGLGLELPVPLRTARGELKAARSERLRLLREQQFLRERIAVEIRVARLEMVTARRRVELAQRQAELAEQLAAAERDRFALGDSTILVVNLREEAAAEAAASHVDAVADYRRARAGYDVACGRPPRR